MELVGSPKMPTNQAVEPWIFHPGTCHDVVDAPRQGLKRHGSVATVTTVGSRNGNEKTKRNERTPQRVLVVFFRKDTCFLDTKTYGFVGVARKKPLDASRHQDDMKQHV